MSGGGSANNSWTILTPEETAAETLRPLADGTEHHEEHCKSTTGHAENNPSAQGAASAGGLVVQDHPVSEAKKEDLNEASRTAENVCVPSSVTDALIHSSEVSSTSLPGSDALSQLEGAADNPVHSSTNLDSFSDSYSHLTPSPDEPPAALLSIETLGGVEFTPQEERLKDEGAPHLLHREEIQQEGDGSDLMADPGKQADSLEDLNVGEERPENTGEGGDTEVRRRRSLLAALERVGRTEDEEEGEEEFQLPRRGDESGFSVNKCILGAVLLLGLGTIFFSGVFMDLDEESDYGTRELKDSEVPGKQQEWLKPEVPPPPGEAGSSDLLNKITKGNQQISLLQAQLQAQKEELKRAKGQAVEGTTERLRWEEENSRLKKEMAALPVLQKDNERMKRELSSVPALQKEVETLRVTVTQLKHLSASEAVSTPVSPTASPPSGQPEDSRQGTAGATEKQSSKPREGLRAEKKKDWKDKYDKGEKKEFKESKREGEKRERKEGSKTEPKEKERKSWKQEQGKIDRVKDKEGKQEKKVKEKDWKKEKVSRGDEGKPWKDREGKKEWTERSERKEWKEERDRKKTRYDKENQYEGTRYESPRWRGKEDKKERRGGKDHKEEWKGEKEFKKGKDRNKESGKEQWEKKDWKEKGEKEWKKDTDWRNKDGGKEGKGKGERKHLEGGKKHDKEKGKDEGRQLRESDWKNKHSKDDEEWKRKDERKHREKKEEWKRKEKKNSEDLKRDKSSFQKEDEQKFTSDRRDQHKEHQWGQRKPAQTHHRFSQDQPEYWTQQRDQLQHNPKPPQHCHSVETCAEAEGLLPVPLPEFQAVLQTYLTKAEEAGVDSSKREELRNLATEFFKDGVFVHDQLSFQEFVEDISDILEDMVEGDDDDDDEEDEEEDSAIEKEMEMFESEVMKKFSQPGSGEKKERVKGEWKECAGARCG